MIQNLEKLCSISGISGREKAVSEEIEQQIKGHCEYHYDNLGNLIAVKKGKNPRTASAIIICFFMFLIVILFILIWVR